jgi:hypothetical protein
VAGAAANVLRFGLGAQPGVVMLFGFEFGLANHLLKARGAVRLVLLRAFWRRIGIGFDGFFILRLHE